MKFTLVALLTLATSALAAPGAMANNAAPVEKRECCYDDCMRTCEAFACTGNDWGVCGSSCNGECTTKCDGKTSC